MKQTVTIGKTRVNQCQKPTAWLGRFVLWNMNSRHSKVSDWGLSHISVDKHHSILDVGCGGGRTVGKLAALASRGKVYGVDISRQSVAMSSRVNRPLIEQGRVEIVEGSVSQLPFPDQMFDLITAVETHFWWPDLTTDIREVWRTMKPGGTLVIIAEVYKAAPTKLAAMIEKHSPSLGMKLLTVNEHRELLENAGFSEVKVMVDSTKGWITALGKKRA